MDNAIALGVKPLQLDIATPLLTAAKIKQSQIEGQQHEMAMRQSAAGEFARGVAVYADKPEFAQKWGEGMDDLKNRGLIDPQSYARMRDNPSPLILKQILAQTTSPELTFRQQEAGRAQANTDRAFGLQEKQFAETVRQHDIGANAPVVVPYGSGLANKKGEMIKEPTNSGLLDKETLSMMADQYIAGDTSVLTNLGRGAQGAENIVALRKSIADKNAAAGQGGAEQAMRNAEYFGTKAGQRTVGVKSANIELAATEFKQVLPIVQEASKAVSRTSYPDLNKIIQMYNEKTGDPAIVKFGGGINTLVNLYARAISPGGVGTVDDKSHAREILQKAWAQGQFDAATGMMSQEIDAALASPEKVREDMRKRFLGGVKPANTKIPQQAIDMLKKDPKSAEKFDEVFGTGEAAKILGVTK